MEKQDFIDELDAQIANLEKQLARLKEKKALLSKLETAKE
jgi:uncharacterized coiled-coil protein SlyX